MSVLLHECLVVQFVIEKSISLMDAHIFLPVTQHDTVGVHIFSLTAKYVASFNFVKANFGVVLSNGANEMKGFYGCFSISPRLM